MRLLLILALGTMAAVVLATGGGSQSDSVAEVREAPPPGVIQTGPTLGPLSPDELRYQPVTVPEPVWASVLAACAVILLRRGRI
jgi:hypothetical protein